MKIKLKDILPNPHRELTGNPLKEEKIEKLRSSIKDTGFWENVNVRKSEEHPDKYEIACGGHHRVEAALLRKDTEECFKQISEPRKETNKMYATIKTVDAENLLRDVTESAKKETGLGSAFTKPKPEEPAKQKPLTPDYQRSSTKGGL